MSDPAAAWNKALQTLRSSEVEEKGKALESLQQLADQMAINLGGEVRVKVVFSTLSALQELLDNTPPKLESAQQSGSELRAAAFHLISKLNFTSLVQTSSSSYIKLSGIAFDACFAAINSDNEENGRLCCKTMGMIIKGRRQVLQHYPNSGVEYNSQVQTLVNLLIKQLEGLEALWQAKVAGAAESKQKEEKKETPPVRASESLKVLVELCQTVNMSISYTSSEVATEYGRTLWPLLLSGIAVAYDEIPPPETAASAYSGICEDIASVQTRILQLIGALSPAKLEVSTADSIKLVDSIIRMLHTAPVSANTNREMLVSARQILAAGLKAPPEDQLNIHVRSKILDLLKDGALFSRQRVDTHQYIARQVVIDITLLARKQLSISQLDNILDVFTSDLQNEHLPLTIQIRVSELVMRLLEHLTANLRVQRSTDPSTVKPLFCKCLIALLSKIDSLAHHSSSLVERLNSDSKEAEARTIGIRWPWVPHIDEIGSHVMPAKTDVTKETEHTRQTIIRCLQSLVHTFSGLNMLTGTDAKAPVLMPVELRLVADGLSSALRAIRTIQQGLPLTQAHTMYDSIPHILMYLNYSVFTDLMFSHFDILFEAVLEDEQLWSIFPMMLKSSREHVRPQLVQKQLIIVQAILQYVVNNELQNLSQPGKRASVAIKLADVALRRLPDPSFKEAQFLPLIPIYKQLLTSCMKLVQVSDNTDNYLTLLLMACKAVSQKADVQHHQLISHVVDTGVVADLLRLLFSMLQGPVVGCAQRDQIAALLLQMPCHLSDLIKQDALMNLTKPLLLAFRSSNQEIVSLAFQVMELWTDSLTPQFLDAKMTTVMPGMLEALSGYVNKSPFGQRALTLLGKFGGRSHAHIKGPQPIEYYTSLDKAFRPVFVFKPTTSCLVPLDVCINLLLEDKWKPSLPDKHYREQAFKFIASCLNRVLNMDNPVPDSNTSLDDQLASLLAQTNIKVPQTPNWSANSKATQHYVTEEKAVEDMVIGMIMFSSHDAVATEAKRYVSALAVHLAMLFVTGKAQSEQETGMVGPWSASQPANSFTPASGNLYMNMLAPVRAFAKALQRDDSAEIKAACTALAELVVAVLTLSEARKATIGVVKSEPEAEAAGEGKVDTPAAPNQTESSPGAKTRAPGDAAAAEEGNPEGSPMGPPPAQKQKAPPDAFAKLRAQLPATSPSSQTGLPAVLDDITTSVLRASCGDSWSCRIGGAMGLGVLVKALPAEYLKPWAPQFCAALCRVFRLLPEHATAQIAALSKILRELSLKVVRSATPVKKNDDEDAMDVDAAPSTGDVQQLQDYDIVGVLDQLCLSLFSSYSSDVCRGAALDALHAVAEAMQLKASDLVGERLKEPHIALPSLTFFYRTSSSSRKQSNTTRVILLHNALTTAQVLATFVRMHPTLAESAEMLGNNVSEALRLLNSSDDIILRMLIPARDSLLNMNPCAALKIACMEFLSALIQQPAWCEAEENQENIGQIVELLTMHLLHPNEKLADLGYTTLMNTACNLEAPECSAKIMSALEGTLGQIGVAIGTANEAKVCTNKKQIQQRLNSTSFIKGLHRTLSLFSSMVPDALGLTLVQHLSGWVNPSDMLRPAPAEGAEGAEQPGGSLPADFAPGDELHVPAALLHLFHLLPPSSRDLLQTSNNRHGLIILTIELEQVLEKHVHSDNAGMSNIKLWSQLRPPLLRFLCKHLNEAAHYFFNMEDCRLFQPDYFWMLHDLTLHELGDVLLDAICNSGSLWSAVLDRVLRDVGEPGSPFTPQAFRVLHLMSSITKKRPMWLTEQVDLWPRIQALWEHPNRTARLASGFHLASHERAESHMLATLILSYIDKNKEELPRICDLFTLFAHPVANTLFLTKYCSEDLMKNFSVQQRSALIKYFMSELLTEKWPAQVLTETMCYVIIPMLKDAEKKQEIPELLPDELLDDMFETICKQQSNKYIQQHLSCEQVKCMCETQKALQIVMQAVPAVRWQKHCKAMISLCWYVMRVRREEILMDVTLLTAAKYFKHIVPLQLTHNSMRDRLARHYLQIFVTLLRTSAPEHDQMLVFDAVDAMMPYMEVYAGPSASSGSQDGSRVSQPAPIWLNYVRKCMMDYTESPGISSQNTFMSIAHVWRIVICYADHFYPHIAHLNTQFIQCMPRLISNAAHGMEHWPVVLDMGLCIAYWIRNLLAGRPIEHTRVAQGAKRSRAGEDEPERATKQRTADATDVSNAAPAAPAEGAAAEEGQAAGNTEAGVEDQGPAAPAGAEEQVEPGSTVAEKRLASVKLTSGILETLLSTCVRVAIWTDRHGARAKSPAGQGWRSGDQQHSAGMWSRSMYVLKALHELLPTTHIKLQSVVMRALKESAEPQASQTSVISSLLHIATFAHNAPGLLEDILPILSDRLMLLFQSPDNAVTADLCTLMRVLEQQQPGTPASPEKAKFRGEVTHHMVQQLSSVAADTAEPTTLAQSASSKNGIVMRAVIVTSLHLLNTMLDCGSTTEQTVDLVRMLPPIYHLFSKFLKQLGTANNNLMSVLATELPLKPGSFLHTFNLLQSMMKHSIVLNTISFVARASNRVVTSIDAILCVFLQVKVPSEIGPQFACHVVSLIDTMVQTSSGPILKEQTAHDLLQHVLDTLRKTQIRNANTPGWIADIEQLLYSICSNTDGLYSQELSDKCFGLERDYGVGIASSNIEMRNKFRAVYERRMGESRLQRLLFLVREQVWLHNMHTFWIPHALGLMLSMLDTNRTLILGKTACQGIPVLHHSKSGTTPVPDTSQRNDAVSISQQGTASVVDGRESVLETAPSAMNMSVNMDSAPSMPEEGGQVSTAGSVELPSSAKELISKYADFLRDARKGKVAQLATAMYECSIVDERMAQHLYACIFPILWQSLEQEEQMSLARPIVMLLTRVSDRQYEDSLQDASPHTDNAVAALKAINHSKSVKVLMHSVQMCQPQPKLPAELTKCIAKNHCAWHVGVPLLESHVVLFPEETRTFHALADLYRVVNEEDLALGLWKAKCYGTMSDKGRDGKASLADPASADHDHRLGNALTNLQLGHWDEAATALASLNRFYCEVYQQANQSPQLQGTPPDHVLGKAQLIIEEWIGCMKQLNRWQDLHHVATSCSNPQLKVECEWRLGLWDSLTQTIKSTQLSETPANAMVTCYALAIGGRQSELAAHLTSAMARLQHEWSLLPPCDVNAKIAMLQKANQWVEVSDGAKVVQEIKRCTMNSMQMASEQFSATSDTCETWRLRMPNVHDSLLHWATIVHWRNIIYDYMIQHFMNLEELNPSLYSLGFKDKSRSVNSLARVARKHGLPSLANHFINNMYRYPTMEVSEAFAKIQEQCKAYSEAKDQQAMGLTLINNTNLSYFPNEQKAAVFKLQGMLFEAMDDSEQAAQLYFTSLHIKEDAQSWLMWGKLCASKGERCGSDIIKARNLGEQSKNMTNQLMSKQHEYNENAVSCFFTALRLNAQFGVFLVPHLLALLAHTSFITPCPMQQVVRDEMQHGPPPAHVLLPHIHYLVESLSRGEREIAKWLLRHVAQAFPQSAYSPLRVGVCHTREVVQRWLKEHESCSPSDQSQRKQEMKNLPETRAFEYARELFEQVRARQQIVSCNLERFFSEVAGRFNQKPEERLYNVVHTLLQRCYRLPLHKSSTVPEDMKRELKNVCDACLTHELTVATRRRGMPAEMRERFVRDVQPSPTTTLQQLMSSLKKWLAQLKEQCEGKFPPVAHLEEDFPVLAHMDFTEMELPGQFQQLEFSPEACVFVVRLGTRVSLVRRHGVSMRRIELICSDGVTRHFTVTSTQAHNLSSTDQRMMGVYRSVNWLLRKYPEARRRNLQMHAPIMVSMWPSARLVQESSSMMTVGEVWEQYWARAGRESDKAIILFKDRVHQLMAANQEAQQPKTPAECKLQAYLEIIQKQGLASDQILSQFIFKMMPTTSHVFLFKKQFTSQLALTSLFSYLISNAAPAPNKLMFERGSGAVFLQDMAVVYPGQHEQRSRNREMPYRMTRNVSNFISPFGLEGWFLISQVLAAQSMTRTKQNIHWPLYLFCRDDVTAHNLRSRLKVRTKTAEELDASNTRLGLLITQLVNDSMNRLREISGAHDAGAISKARTLLKLAQEPKHLCMQDALFLPWY